MKYKKQMMLLSLLSLAAVAACSTTSLTATTTSDVVCVAFQPITYSASKDTKETVEQVREYNAKLKAICPSLFK